MGKRCKTRRTRRAAAVLSAVGAIGIGAGLATPAWGHNSGPPPGRDAGAITGSGNGATVTHYNQYSDGACQKVENPGDPSPSGGIGWPWVGASDNGPHYNC
jgi:hypothetical protein